MYVGFLLLIVWETIGAMHPTDLHAPFLPAEHIPEFV